jgi:hypothetical protein
MAGRLRDIFQKSAECRAGSTLHRQSGGSPLADLVPGRVSGALPKAWGCTRLSTTPGIDQARSSISLGPPRWGWPRFARLPTQGCAPARFTRRAAPWAGLEPSLRDETKKRVAHGEVKTVAATGPRCLQCHQKTTVEQKRPNQNRPVFTSPRDAYRGVGADPTGGGSCERLRESKVYEPLHFARGGYV